MHLKVISVGQRMPDWVDAGFETYSKRFPREMRLDLVEIPLGQRGRKSDTARAMEKEGEQMLAALKSSDHVVALELEGRSWSTEQLAGQLEGWQMQGQDIAFLIGGPDGLARSCRDRADQRWSVSPLTLPHPMVRVLIAEQLYRAWTINQNHPYHRAS